MKKYLVLIICISFIFCVKNFEVVADAANNTTISNQTLDIGGSCGDNLKWELDTHTGVLTISGKGEMAKRPPWRDYSKKIVRVVIADGVTTISDNAFSNFSKLTSISLPKSISYIGESAFFNCSELSDIYIPNAISYIGSSAFEYCNKLKSVHVNDLVSWCGVELEETLFEKGWNLYLGETLIKNLVIPEGVCEIKPAVFYGCSNIESVEIPLSVTKIGQMAFGSCKALTRITISENVEYLGKRAFAHCSDLRSAVIYSDSVKFDTAPFYKCHIDFSIYGNKNSTSERHAYAEDIRFFLIDDGFPLYDFTDVSTKDEFYDAVKYAVDTGLFNGTSKTTFSPSSSMTRAMFVTVLGRYAKADVATYQKSTFTDSLEGMWYTSYVEWAAANNVVGGYGDGRFGVDDSVTIEQVCVILARFAGFKDAPDKAEASMYSSLFDAVSVWAVDSVKWAVYNNILTNSIDEINPKSPATRAQVAEMMHAFYLAYRD